MPRNSSAASRVALQTTTSVSKTGQKQASKMSSSSRTALFTDSPKLDSDQLAASGAAAKKEMYEVPDSQPRDGSGQCSLQFLQCVQKSTVFEQHIL